jgi:hypothetical protein
MKHVCVRIRLNQLSGVSCGTLWLCGEARGGPPEHVRTSRCAQPRVSLVACRLATAPAAPRRRHRQCQCIHIHKHLVHTYIYTYISYIYYTTHAARATAARKQRRNTQRYTNVHVIEVRMRMRGSWSLAEEEEPRKDDGLRFRLCGCGSACLRPYCARSPSAALQPRRADELSPAAPQPHQSHAIPRGQRALSGGWRYRLSSTAK